MWKKKEMKNLYKRMILVIPLTTAIVLILFRPEVSALFKKSEKIQYFLTQNRVTHKPILF